MPGVKDEHDRRGNRRTAAIAVEKPHARQHRGCSRTGRVASPARDVAKIGDGVGPPRSGLGAVECRPLEASGLPDALMLPAEAGDFELDYVTAA